MTPLTCSCAKPWPYDGKIKQYRDENVCVKCLLPIAPSEKPCCELCEGFDSKGAESWSYCSNSKCPCHTPSVDSWEQRIISLVDGAKLNPDLLAVALIEHFRECLASTRHSTLLEVEGVVEKMIIKDSKCYCKTHPEHNCGQTSNEAIADVLAALRALGEK